MRRKGKTYAEIRQTIHVAKSTLSVWFREVKLSAPQKQTITKKRLAAARRGAFARKESRLREESELLSSGIRDVPTLTKKELWLIGVALYWAEGSKQRSKSVSERIMFSNSDYRMIAVFLRWLQDQGFKDENLTYEIYIHTDRAKDTDMIRAWWAKKLKLPVSALSRVYYKKGNPKTNRTNVDDLYHGLIRIKVRGSTSFNRKVSGWVEGITRASMKGTVSK